MALVFNMYITMFNHMQVSGAVSGGCLPELLLAIVYFFFSIFIGLF